MTRIIVSFLLIILAQEDISHATASPEASITKLDLSKKGLTSLKDYVFSQYPQLEELDLSGNDLTHIKEDAFAKNKKLRSINLSGNTNLEFPTYSTIFISDIAQLNISNCGIETLPQSAFDGLRFLKVIDLSNNPLEEKSFPTTPFDTIESLEKVILPVENKELLKQLCLAFNLTVQIKNEKQDIPQVQCSNYITYEPELEPSATEHLPENPPPEIPKALDSTIAITDKIDSHPPSAKPKLEPRASAEVLPALPTSNTTGEPAKPAESTTEVANIISTNVPKLEPRVAPAVDETKPESPNPTAAVIADATTEEPINHTDKPVEVIKPPANSSDVNKSEQIQQLDNQEPAKVGEVTEAGNTGSTILIVLVVLVVISGLAAFGYKFYKNKTARAESEQVERELKQIVTARPSSQDVVEKEPLMNNHAARENGDVKSSPNGINNALHPHVGPASRRNSGSPYQPTTTTFKPEGTSEVK